MRNCWFRVQGFTFFYIHSYLIACSTSQSDIFCRSLPSFTYRDHFYLMVKMIIWIGSTYTNSLTRTRNHILKLIPVGVSKYWIQFASRLIFLVIFIHMTKGFKVGVSYKMQVKYDSFGLDTIKNIY